MRSPDATASLDSRSLDALRGEAARDPKGAARKAAVQFESLFTQMVLKSMRDATPKSDSAGPAGDSFTGLMDAQLAQQFAGRPGGLAEMIERQLTRHMQNMPAPQAGAAAVTGAAMLPRAAMLPGAAQMPRAAMVSSAAQGSGAAVLPGMPGLSPSASAVQPSTAAQPQGSRAAQFIQRMLPHAQEAERQTGVPASFILGQAALESGWGRAQARNPDGSNSHNIFGVKATAGWRGDSAGAMTTEFQDGQAVRQRADFRSYGSYTEAFADYARMISSSPRYRGVVQGASTAEAFAVGMQRAGYATDPQYAAKLARTINHTLALQRAMA